MNEIIPEGYKKCHNSECEQIKPLSEFYTKGNWCKFCHLARSKERARKIKSGEIPQVIPLEKWCPGCSKTKPASEFYPARSKISGLTDACRECNWKRYSKEPGKAILFAKLKEEGKRRCSKCKEIKDFSEFYVNISNPDGLCCECKRCKKFLRAVFATRRRCREYPSYIEKGIQSFLTFKDVKFLWDEADADNIERPEIHRKDNDGDYIIENCVYISREEHQRIHRELQLQTLKKGRKVRKKRKK